jgi:hypothetical protein
MDARDLEVVNRAGRLRDFVRRYENELAAICPPTVAEELDNLVSRITRVEELLREQMALSSARRRNDIRKELMTFCVYPILSGAGALGQRKEFERFTSPTKYKPRRFVIYMETLLRATDVRRDELARVLPRDCLARAAQLTHEFEKAIHEAEVAKEQVRVLTSTRAMLIKSASAMIVHLRTTIAPHLVAHDATLELAQFARLPAHRASNGRRLKGGSQPRALPPGSAVEQLDGSAGTV